MTARIRTSAWACSVTQGPTRASSPSCWVSRRRRQPPAPVAPAPFQGLVTVIGGDADVFDIAHNDVPDPATGVRGLIIGTLKNGSQVYSGVPCKNGWCQVNSSVIQGGNGFVEQAHLQFP